MEFLAKSYLRAALVIITLCLAVPPASAEEKLQLYEQKIKAGLVYNLLKYTTWPQESGAGEGRLQICLFGGDPFDGYLSPLEGRTAQQAPIAVMQIRQVKQAESCSVVIIPRDQESILPELLKFLNGRHILTISDIRNFAKSGGMVELAKEGEKINMYINKNTVERAGLDIQGRMLRLARIVSG